MSTPSIEDIRTVIGTVVANSRTPRDEIDNGAFDADLHKLIRTPDVALFSTMFASTTIAAYLLEQPQWSPEPGAMFGFEITPTVATDLEVVAVLRIVTATANEDFDTATAVALVQCETHERAHRTLALLLSMIVSMPVQ